MNNKRSQVIRDEVTAVVVAPGEVGSSISPELFTTLTLRLDDLIMDLIMFHLKLIAMKKKQHVHTPKPHDLGKGTTTIIGDALKTAGNFKKPAPSTDKFSSKGDQLT